MTNYGIDNGAQEQIGATILWQYDKAERLVGLISIIASFFSQGTKEFFDRLLVDTDVDTATDFGLSVLGMSLGVPRPSIVGDGGTEPLSTEAYRKFIKARAYILSREFTVPQANKFLKDVFGQSSGVNNVSIAYGDGTKTGTSYGVSFDGSGIEGELEWLFDNDKDFSLPWPAAFRTNDAFDGPFFSLVEEQPQDPSDVWMNGLKCGGLDESTLYDDFDDASLIPENERIVQ